MEEINAKRPVKLRQVIDLQAFKNKENAAIAMCGGLLGNCFLMAEVIETVMIDFLAVFKKKRWFRHELKHFMNNARKELHTTIVHSITNSPSNADYMREMADAIYDIIRPDIIKLNNAVAIELGRNNVRECKDLADIVTIDILLRYIGVEYDDILRHMNTVFPTYYDTWYRPARCTGPAVWWGKALQLFASTNVDSQIDLNNITSIDNGIHIIQHKMNSREVAEIASAQAREVTEEGSGREIYDKALETLGLIQMK